MGRLPVTALLCCTLLGGAPGCGDDEPAAAPVAVDSLSGAMVGELAEQQLEAEHPDIAVGTVTCPDLDWELGATVRCLKVSELSAGRRVKIPGTVTVTSTEGGGRLRIELDDRVAEFGLDGAHLAGEVTRWVRAQDARDDSPEVDCPYLVAVVGTEVRCRATLAAGVRAVVVRVEDVDAGEYRTRFSIRWGTPSGARLSTP